jgi:hypothetical protein
MYNIPKRGTKAAKIINDNPGFGIHVLKSELSKALRKAVCINQQDGWNDIPDQIL